MSGEPAPPSADINVDELTSYLEESSIRLAVFGEFSAGKTTVLNALIGEEILSVAVEPTTAVPTRICYGREFNIYVDRVEDGPLALFENDPPFWTRFVGRRDILSTLEKQQDTIRDFLQRWTKEGERANQVKRVVIELPLDWLKGGLELVDTPGVNNEFVRHQGFTEQEASTADIAVLLMDARQGGGKRTEFEFMNDVQKQVERCIVAPNKMDLVPADEREEFLDFIREEALPNHWEGAVTPPVIGISALAALHPGEHDEPGLVDSFNRLEKQLEEIAKAERGKLLLARKGNPEKELFARARELEGDELYGRAHRLYFDLLDILEAAGLAPAPAEEGVARCEEHLSAQVDALDSLNERYNEAVALADVDPDAALEQLRDIRDEKADLRLKDGDLQASIEQLQSRIEEREQARSRILRTKATVEQHRHNENWIEAAEAAQAIPPLIETAELSEEQAAELRQFVATQEQDRGEWAEERWMLVKDQADACVEEQRYLDAAGHLDDLKAVAPYTPFEGETADFAEEVTRKAELEADYRLAVRDAIEEVEVILQSRVDPEERKAVESAIETAEETFQALYGVPELPKRPPLGDAALPLTIDQKLGLALQLRALAEESRSREAAETLTDKLRERRAEMQALSLNDRDGLDLVEEYPDHPEVEAALDELLNEQLPFWALPWRIRRTRSAVEEYRDYLPEEKVEARVRELKKRHAAFRWDKANSPRAVILSLLGVFFGVFVAFASGALLGFLAGSLLVSGSILIQYFRPHPGEDVEEDSSQTREPSSRNHSSSKRTTSQGQVSSQSYTGSQELACTECGLTRVGGQTEECTRCDGKMRPTSEVSRDVYISKSSNGDCFVATAVYGKYDHPDVLSLQRFRDETLCHSALGQAFIAWYYRYGPALAKYVEQSHFLKQCTRWILKRFVKNWLR